MNKAELVNAMATETGLSKKDTEATLNAFINAVTKELSQKGKVQLVGFGTFETRERAARTGRNPQTGKELKIAASIVSAFKAGKALKDTVNKIFLMKIYRLYQHNRVCILIGDYYFHYLFSKLFFSFSFIITNKCIHAQIFSFASKYTFSKSHSHASKFTISFISFIFINISLEFFLHYS